MQLLKAYTYLLIADLATSEIWYANLLGRKPDHRPMETLVQWDLSDVGGLGISTDEEIAGTGAIFLLVADIPAERRRLNALGIVLGSDIAGDYSTLAQVHDPDGNVITLASPLSHPYPPA